MKTTIATLRLLLAAILATGCQSTPKQTSNASPPPTTPTVAAAPAKSPPVIENAVIDPHTGKVHRLKPGESIEIDRNFMPVIR